MLGRIFSPNNYALSNNEFGYGSNLLTKTQSSRNNNLCPNYLIPYRDIKYKSCDRTWYNNTRLALSAPSAVLLLPVFGAFRTVTGTT